MVLNVINGSPGFDPKIDSVTNPMAMVPSAGKPTPLNNPTPDPMSPKRHKRAVLRVRNDVPEPKLPKREDLPMTDTMKKADKDATERKSLETASSMFALSRQLHAYGRSAEAFDLFVRAMDTLEVSTSAEIASAEAGIRHNVRTLLASAFDENTGDIIAAPTEEEKALADAISGEEPAVNAKTDTKSGDIAGAVLAALDASLNRPASPLQSVINSL